MSEYSYNNDYLLYEINMFLEYHTLSELLVIIADVAERKEEEEK